MGYTSFMELTKESKLNNIADKNRFHRMGNTFVNVSLLLYVFPLLLIRSFIGFHRINKNPEDINLYVLTSWHIFVSIVTITYFTEFNGP